MSYVLRLREIQETDVLLVLCHNDVTPFIPEHCIKAEGFDVEYATMDINNMFVAGCLQIPKVEVYLFSFFQKQASPPDI